MKKILIADDDLTSRLVLGATLKKFGHAVTMVEDGRQALDAWRREHHTLVISDWIMPEGDGLWLCRQIRTEPALHYTYIILLTALSSRGQYLEGMQAGADDFISKPFDEEYLQARLHVAERILSLHEALRAEATHDRLTGLWNRAAILDFLHERLASAASAPAGGPGVGIIIADLDHFKNVNDSHGHAAGDHVLQEAARRMQSCLGPDFCVGRYGGEEFLIVVPGSDARQVLAVAETVRAAIGDTPIQAGAGPLALTVSLGATLSGPTAPGSADVLISVADHALYRAKEAGRNRVEFTP